MSTQSTVPARRRRARATAGGDAESCSHFALDLDSLHFTTARRDRRLDVGRGVSFAAIREAREERGVTEVQIWGGWLRGE